MRDTTPNVCSVTGCPRPREKSWRNPLDLCSTHAKRNRLYGSPTATWLRTTELTPYRILVKKYRRITTRGYIIHPPQDALNALAEWLNPEGPIPALTATTPGARSAKERACFKRMLHWWWNAPGKTRSRFAVANTQRKVLLRVYWRLVAVACAVEEQDARFRGKSDHFAYALAVMKMRQGWRAHHGAARRLFALRWSELSGRLAVPVLTEARAILARKEAAEREAVEARQQEAQARIGHRSLVRILTQAETMLRGGWTKKVGPLEEAVYDPELQGFVTDATPEELAAARIERRTRTLSTPEYDHQADAHRKLGQFNTARW